MTGTLTTTPLSLDLRDATAAVHEAAEGSEFMSRLLEGAVGLPAVAHYTGQLWFIYNALEAAVERAAGSPFLAPFADPRLARVLALEADLAILEGEGWRDRIDMLPSTARYVEHLGRLGEADGLLVLAHHYVRYLGDVSGGQVIARMLGRHYGEVAQRATAFYDFSPLGKVKPFRDGYRKNLDGLSLDGAERATLLSEAVRAFGLNTAIFEELGARYCG